MVVALDEVCGPDYEDTVDRKNDSKFTLNANGNRAT